MTFQHQRRVAAGVPAGGQFATVSRSEASSALAAPPAANGDAVSFADCDRDSRVEAMRAEIDTALETLSNEDGWTRFLDAQAKFHRYSLNNTLLILAQRPDATRVAGFRDWQNQHRRSVRKGEKAIWVLAPITRKVAEIGPDGQEREVSRIVGTRPVPVFDVSQTDGEPLPENPTIERAALEGDAPPKMTEDLHNLITGYGYAVEYGATGEAGGYTDFSNKKVVINSERGPREQARTLAHEAAHIALGHGDEIASYHQRPGGRRPDMEVEAESVAYVIGRHYGLDDIGGASFNYIDGWARGDKEKVKATAGRVVTAAKKILDGVGA